MFEIVLIHKYLHAFESVFVQGLGELWEKFGAVENLGFFVGFVNWNCFHMLFKYVMVNLSRLAKQICQYIFQQTSFVLFVHIQTNLLFLRTLFFLPAQAYLQ